MRRALVLALLLPTLAACGGEDDEAAVRGVAAAYGEAAAKKDYQRICDDLIAAELKENVARVGLPCELAFKQGLEDVRRPRLTVGEVRVDGDAATVQITSTAAGQKLSKDALELGREDDGWRITALGR